MPGNHKPRKRYVPKLINRDPVSLAINMAAVFTGDEQRTLMQPVNEALAAIRSGQGSGASWQVLADVFNIGEQLVLLKIGSNLAEEFDAAQVALLQLRQRVVAGGRWTLYAQELSAITTAAELYEVQLGLCSTAEHLDAIQRVIRRSQGAIAAGLAEQAPHHIRVAPPAPTTT